jgi:hypothetical protein
LQLKRVSVKCLLVGWKRTAFLATNVEPYYDIVKAGVWGSSFYFSMERKGKGKI